MLPNSDGSSFQRTHNQEELPFDSSIVMNDDEGSGGFHHLSNTTHGFQFPSDNLDNISTFLRLDHEDTMLFSPPAGILETGNLQTPEQPSFPLQHVFLQQPPVIVLSTGFGTNNDSSSYHNVQPNVQEPFQQAHAHPSNTSLSQQQQYSSIPLSIMNSPLPDLPAYQRDVHTYHFEGCEFVLPKRYKPLMREIAPGSSEQQVVFLGRGAYGQVIAAIDTFQSGMIVAIKKIQKVFSRAPYRMLRGKLRLSIGVNTPIQKREL